jgi:hypothetical protein
MQEQNLSSYIPKNAPNLEVKNFNSDDLTEQAHLIGGMIRKYTSERLTPMNKNMLEGMARKYTSESLVPMNKNELESMMRQYMSESLMPMNKELLEKHVRQYFSENLMPIGDRMLDRIVKKYSTESLMSINIHMLEIIVEQYSSDNLMPMDAPKFTKNNKHASSLNDMELYNMDNQKLTNKIAVDKIQPLKSSSGKGKGTR